MLIDELGHIILTQLNEQPLVVLPGFGGFVKDQVSAELDTSRGRIHPPKNTIVFNSRLSHNDGQLIAAIATEQEVSYNEADVWLTDAISELKFLLEHERQAEIPGIGTLKKTLEESLVFEVVDEPLLVDDFFGLKPLSAKPIEEDNLDKAKKLVSPEGLVATKVRTLPIKQIAKYAAAAVTIGLIAWLPVQNGALQNGKMLAQEFNPFSTKTEAAYSSRTFNENWLNKGFEREDVLADKFSKEFISLYVSDNAKNAIVVKTDAIPTELGSTLDESATKIESPIEEASRYRVIAATFKSRSEAANYVAKMIKRGFGAEYAGVKNNQHLVAYGTYNSKADAEKMLASVSLSNKQAQIVAVK